MTAMDTLEIIQISNLDLGSNEYRLGMNRE